jgi:hypothetical protein
MRSPPPGRFSLHATDVRSPRASRAGPQRPVTLHLDPSRSPLRTIGLVPGRPTGPGAEGLAITRTVSARSGICVRNIWLDVEYSLVLQLAPLARRATITLVQEAPARTGKAA